MCLATAYKKKDDSVICRNIAGIDVQDGKLVIRDILGDEMVIEGKLLTVDLANSTVQIQCD